MLEQLSIRNFILIDELNITFSAGLNALSGETGAGKSIIIDAVSLLCGGKSRGEYLRDPEKSAWLEAVFSMEKENGLTEWLVEQGWELGEEPLLLSREIRRDGRSIARLNGRSISLKMLGELAGFLLDLHGQNDRQQLLDPKNYLGYVDCFVEDSAGWLHRVETAYDEWQALCKERDRLSFDEGERLQRLDFLRFQMEEIEKAQLKAGEEEQLKQQRDRIQNVERLETACRKIADSLFETDMAADSQIYRALSTAKTLAEDPFFEKMAAGLETVYYDLQEQKYQLDDFREKLETEPGLLDEIEERLYRIHTLEKKYGADIPAILTKYAQMCEQKEKLENVSGHLEGLEAGIAERWKRYQTAAAELRRMRMQAKTRLEETIRHELKELNLPNIRFEIRMTERALPGRDGLDEAEYLFSANPGEELRPLQKIASGGELSRFTLALKIALAERYAVGTIVLDEIDVGLGGMAQRGMAVKLKEFSGCCQLLLVTHAAQIAAMAERHFQITKTVQEGKTSSSIRILEGNERVEELARMLDGDQFSEISLQHAQRLLEEAGKSE